MHHNILLIEKHAFFAYLALKLNTKKSFIACAAIIKIQISFEGKKGKTTLGEADGRPKEGCNEGLCVSGLRLHFGEGSNRNKHK